MEVANEAMQIQNEEYVKFCLLWLLQPDEFRIAGLLPEADAHDLA